ncbi:hypothetical protein [Embleya sp. NBC_00896]|uniref:hypothetical protein n=1 Tax=Embleya sp. NBC_00896 TaxID=2975961 RepID=UPI00386BC586|nr:hypothetical protein OG928_19655 [Embleya sp. NBC_00896]
MWPRCPLHGDHPLDIEPEPGEDPHWVCEKDAVAIAALGGLGTDRPPNEGAVEDV